MWIIQQQQQQQQQLFKDDHSITTTLPTQEMERNSRHLHFSKQTSERQHMPASDYPSSITIEEELRQLRQQIHTLLENQQTPLLSSASSSSSSSSSLPQEQQEVQVDKNDQEKDTLDNSVTKEPAAPKEPKEEGDSLPFSLSPQNLRRQVVLQELLQKRDMLLRHNNGHYYSLSKLHRILLQLEKQSVFPETTGLSPFTTTIPLFDHHQEQQHPQRRQEDCWWNDLGAHLVAAGRSSSSHKYCHNNPLEWFCQFVGRGARTWDELCRWKTHQQLCRGGQIMVLLFLDNHRLAYHPPCWNMPSTTSSNPPPRSTRRPRPSHRRRHKRVVKTRMVPRPSSTLLSHLEDHHHHQEGNDLSEEQFDQLLDELVNSHVSEDYSDIEEYTEEEEEQEEEEEEKSHITRIMILEDEDDATDSFSFWVDKYSYENMNNKEYHHKKKKSFAVRLAISKVLWKAEMEDGYYKGHPTRKWNNNNETPEQWALLLLLASKDGNIQQLVGPFWNHKKAEQVVKQSAYGEQEGDDDDLLNENDLDVLWEAQDEDNDYFQGWWDTEEEDDDDVSDGAFDYLDDEEESLLQDLDQLSSLLDNDENDGKSQENLERVDWKIVKEYNDRLWRGMRVLGKWIQTISESNFEEEYEDTTQHNSKSNGETETSKDDRPPPPPPPLPRSEQGVRPSPPPASANVKTQAQTGKSGIPPPPPVPFEKKAININSMKPRPQPPKRPPFVGPKEDFINRVSTSS